MKKLYVVRLSEEERTELTKLVNTGRAAAYRRRHAQILLQADQGQHGPALYDRQIVDKLGVARQTIETVANAVSSKDWRPPWAAASAAATARWGGVRQMTTVVLGAGQEPRMCLQGGLTVFACAPELSALSANGHPLRRPLCQLISEAPFLCSSRAGASLL